MKKIYKTFLSIVVALAMMLAMMPMMADTAYAATSSFVSVRTQIKDSSTSFGGGSVMISGSPIYGIHDQFVANGCKCEFSVGSEVKISAQADEGYHFVEWQRGNYEEYGYGNFTSESYSANAEHTLSALDDNYYLFAIFEKDPDPEYTVTFDARGGSVVAPQQVTKGECATRPDNPTKEGDGWPSFAGWYSDEALTTKYDFRTPVTGDITLYAAWYYGLSVGTYNKTKAESDWKCGRFGIYNSEYGFWEDYGGNCNFTRFEGSVKLKIIPANGYRFIGWYEGEYLGVTEHSSQDMAPKDLSDPNTLLSTDPVYSFVLDKYACVIPVFEEEPLINFVDIGNIWTMLDPIHEVPFTGEINPNEDGLDSYISLKDEAWISSEGAVISKDGSGIPKTDETYKYTATIEAINGNIFDPALGFRFVYGGSEIDSFTVTYNEDNTIAYISDFIDPVIINKVNISGATITGISNKTYNGKAQTQNLTVKAKVNGTTFTLKNGTDYTVAYKNNKAVGTATITITGKGNYTGSINKIFNILPKPATIVKPAAAKKAITVKWKKQAAKMPAKRITGYQVQCSTSKSFNKGVKSAFVKGYSKTSKKYSKLKSKKLYYVRVRTYMKVGNKTYYSKWSATKKIKAK